jgi:parallel beta-helix repeat protein
MGNMKSKSIIILVCLVIVISLIIPFSPIEKGDTAGDEIFVDSAFHSRRTGSPEYPLETIQEAIDQANDGDRIYVYGGEYDEYINVHKRVKLWGSIERGETIISSHVDKRYLVEINADQVEFQGFTLADPVGVSTSPIGALIAIKADNVVIQSNIINHSTAYGIYLSPTSEGSFISGNSINDTTIGINVDSSDTNDIFDNQIINCSDNCIKVQNCENNRLYNNHLNGSNHVIQIQNCVGVNITNNTVSGATYYGLYISDSTNTIVKGNNILLNPGDGINLNSVSYEIVNNTIDANRRGISISNSNGEIHGNTISNNTGTGIYASSNSQSNIIYLNVFENNSVNAQDLGDNTWYSESLIKGNYWDNYYEVDYVPDGAGDGIGDKPYNILGILDIYPIGLFLKPPLKPYDPSPEDLEDDVGLEITLSVKVSDPDSDYLTVYFYNAEDETLINPDAFETDVPSGGTAEYTFNLGFQTAYAWYAVVNDSKLDNRSDVWIFLTKSAPPDNEPPVVDLGGTYTGYLDNQITFDGSGSYDPDGEIVFYRWNFGDGTSEILSDKPTHTYKSTISSPGTYTVTLSVVDDNRTASTGSTTITLLPSTQANKNPTALFTSANSAKVKESITFSGIGSSDEDGIVVNYTWYFGDQTIGYGVSPTHTYSKSGSYTVILTVRDDEGGTNSYSKTVTIKGSSDGDTPGFETIILLVALAIFLIYKKHKK